MIGRLLLLAALLALVAVVVEWRLIERDETPVIADAPQPGYYLKEISLDEFDADGQLRLGLQAASAVETLADGQVELRQVVVNYRALEGQNWQLSAERARVPHGGRIVEFEGDVRMTGRPGGGQQPAELRTARLTLDTDLELAMTRDPVTLAFGPHLMRARGLRADMKAGGVRLESEVHGVFSP